MEESRPALLVVEAGDELREAELDALEARGRVVARLTITESADRPALRELAAALELLRAREGVDGQRIELLGLGRGATLSFLYACQTGGLLAVAMWGGELVRDALDAERPFQPLEMALGLEAPLLVHVGAQTPAGAPERVELIRSTFAQFARDVEFEVHAEGGEPLEGAARARALASTLEFLEGREVAS